jgi:hypothetical protein
MTLSIGTVSVDSSGNVTGFGAAYAVFSGLYAQQSQFFPNPNLPPSDYAGSPSDWSSAVTTAIVKIKQDMARTATGIAALIPYIVNNAVIPANGLLDHSGGICTGSTVIT